MGICIPNKSDQAKFNVLANIVGEKEAERDYYEQDGVVRPPQVVIDKIHERMMNLGKNPLFEALDFNAPELRTSENVVGDIQKIIADHNSKESMRVAEELSTQLGIPYEILSSEEAKVLHGQKTDVPGFYKSGKVYFTEGQMSPDNVFHEFSHPIIKALAKDPEGMKLFNKLYNDLLSEDYGKRIVDDMKADSFYGKNPNSTEFKEEAIVRGMGHVHKEGLTQTGGWLKNLLYAIRQFLRRAFGQKVNVGKLNLNTTLSDLVDMLNKGEQFNLNLDVLKEDSVLMLEKEFDNQMKAVDDVSRVKAQELMNEMNAMIKKQVGAMVPGSIYHEFAKGFVEDDASGLLQRMRFALEKLASENNNRKAIPGIDHLTDEYIEALGKKDAASVVAERISMFVGVLSQADTVIDLFSTKIESLSTGKLTDPMDIDTLFGIGQYVSQWSYFLKNVISYDARNLIGEDQPLHEFIRKLLTKTQELKDEIDSRAVEGVTDILYDHFVESRETSNKQFLSEMERLKESGNMAGYARMYDEYYGVTVEQKNRQTFLQNKKDSSVLTKVELEELMELNTLASRKYMPSRDEYKNILMGLGIDGDFINTYFEGYNNVQDKTVGNFWSFMENKFNEINGNANKNETDFLNGLASHLKATGWGAKRLIGNDALGEALSQVSNKGRINAQGQVESYKVYEFKNNFKGDYQFEMKLLHAEVKVAHAEYIHNPSVQNHIAYVKSKQVYEDFLSDYMHQDMVPEFYDSGKLFRDEVGIKARMRLDDFYEEMDDMAEVALEAHVDDLKAEAVQERWREYEYMFSLTDIHGNMKSGEELAIAQRLQEYRESKRDFYEYNTDSEKFQLAYDKVVEDLVEEGLAPGSAIYNERLDKWVEHNSTVQLNESWYDERGRLLDERKELLSPLTEKNAQIIDIGPLYDQIYALAKPSKDTMGQYNGTSMTKDVQIKIRNLHDDVEQARQQLYTMSGLTKAELDDYTSITDYYDYYGKFASSEDQIAFNEFRRRVTEGLQAFGISKADSRRIQSIDETLRKMSITTSTPYYRDSIEQLVGMSEEATQILNSYLFEKLGIDREAGDVIDEDAVNDILKDDSLIKELRDKGNEFKQWFDNNHYRGERVVRSEDGGKGEIRMMYLRTSLWSHTTPSDVSYYKAFALKDLDGNVRGSLKLKGVPRVPNLNYIVREVKDQYKTSVVERDYVNAQGELVIANINNRGEWLPKTLEQGAKDSEFINEEYRTMFENDRPMWDMLDYFKEHHLKSQRGLGNPQKLGLEFPRNRKRGIENVGVGYIYNRNRDTIGGALGTSRLAESLHNMVRVQEDDIEFGYNSARQTGETFQLNTLTRPISGMYDLELNEVSLDIIEQMGKHQHSIETYRGLSQINSLAQVLRRMVRNETNNPEARAIKRKAKILSWIGNTNEVRATAAAIGNIIEQHFEGYQLQKPRIKGEFGSRLQKAQASLLGKLLGWNSRKWFMFNFISDLTNYLGGSVQFGYKAFDSRHFNANNLAVGRHKAKVANRIIRAQQYLKTAKPLTVQFMDVLDASPDKFLRSIGERGSRTLTKDIAESRIGYGFRQYLQDELNYTAMYGLLDNSKYKFELNGKQVSLDKAIELVNGRIQTKEGVPEDYQIRYDENDNIVLGKKIHQIIKHHHGYLKKTTGIAGKTAESEFINRTLLGKMMFSIIRFFPGMTMDRYQFGVRKSVKGKHTKSKRMATRRFDWYTQTNEYGIFIEALLSSKNLISGLGDIATGNMKGSQIHRVYNSRASRTAMIQVALAVVVNMLIDMLHSNLMFDDGDDDNETGFTFNQMQNGDMVSGEDIPGMISYLKKSTALPDSPFINPAYSSAMLGQEFHAENYWKLQMLRLSLRLERENKTFNPDRIWSVILNLGLNKSAVQEGTAKDIRTLIELGMDLSKGKDVDIKKDAGPYTWQQAGEDKLTHTALSKFMGYNGNMISPADGIETELAFPY